LPQAPTGRAATIPKWGLGGCATGLDAAHQPTEFADGLLQQVRVGRVVDVGLHHGGVDSQLARPQQLVVGELCHQRGVELCDGDWPGAADQLDQGRGVWNRLVQADAAKPPPADRVGDLSAQGLVAELIAVLQVEQA